MNTSILNQRDCRQIFHGVVVVISFIVTSMLLPEMRKNSATRICTFPSVIAIAYELNAQQSEVISVSKTTKPGDPLAFPYPAS
jgi:hypothetical protein